ncbi:hypothetical protein [Leifsonia sp. RAF41]|uniref:hypothetical protein n=1 Tax=Leifsonia sp. RAF41 TaxID=3233056 RepID=UPI003F9CFD9E
MSSDASERWLALSRQFPIGPKPGADLARRAEYQDVLPGQLRQAYWLDAVAAVVIDRVDEAAAEVSVFPATLEPGVENETAIVFEGDASPLRGPVAVWPHSPASIPFSVLGTTIARLSESLPRITHQAMDAEASANGVRRGRRAPGLGSGATSALAELFDAIEVLEGAPRLQAAAPRVPASRLQIPLATIMGSLDVSQPRAMAIRLGKEPLTVEEADRLASFAEIPVEEILGAVEPLPAALQRELQEPRWRDRIRERAIDGDENRARTRLGYEAYQLAARETGEGRERWRQRLETVLAGDRR